MTQAELGDKIGVSFQQIQKYERGGNRIGANRLMEIAQALRVEPSYFLEQSKTDVVDATTLDRFFALPEAGDLIRAVLAIDNRAMRRQLVEVAMTFGKLKDQAPASELTGDSDPTGVS
jgi:transcriptional regulator with XRE-family HTH domain